MRSTPRTAATVATAVAALALLAGCSASGATPGGAGGDGSPTAASPSPGATSAAPGAPSVSATGRPAGLRVSTLPIRLPRAVAREAVVHDGRRLLVAGGLYPGNLTTAASYSLDLATRGRTPLPDLSVPVHDTAGALVGGQPLVLGGGNSSEQSAVQSRAGAGWSVAGRLPTTRSDLTAVTAGGKVYVVGGYDATSPAVASVLVSADGRRWSTFATLPEPVRYPATVVADGAVWVFGGESDGAELTAVQRVDLTTGRARVVTRLPHPLGHAVAAALGGRILLAGGRPGPNTMTARMWWFDPTSHRITHAGRLPRPLSDAAVTPAFSDAGGQTAYVVGGESPAYSDRVLRLHWG